MQIPSICLVSKLLFSIYIRFDRYKLQQTDDKRFALLFWRLLSIYLGCFKGSMPLKFYNFTDCLNGVLLSWQEVIQMWQSENITAKEEAFESIPAGKWKVEAGAGGYISRAVQRTVCCWKTSLLLQITISMRNRDHAAALSSGNKKIKKIQWNYLRYQSKWLNFSVFLFTTIHHWLRANLNSKDNPVCPGAEISCWRCEATQVAVWSLLLLCQNVQKATHWTPKYVSNYHKKTSFSKSQRLKNKKRFKF